MVKRIHVNQLNMEPLRKFCDKYNISYPEDVDNKDFNDVCVDVLDRLSMINQALQGYDTDDIIIRFKIYDKRDMSTKIYEGCFTPEQVIDIRKLNLNLIVI